MDIISVLSFDPAKVVIEKLPTGRKVVKKKTTKKEYEQIVNAHKHVLNNPIKLIMGEMEIKFSVAPVLEWIPEESLLITEYCNGVNIEEILRHAGYVEIRMLINLFRGMFSALRDTGFLWGDFAPRNMVFDNTARTICIFDFERNQILQNEPANAEQFSRYVRNYAREEFSCFLLKNEQYLLFSDFLVEERLVNIAASSLGSKRKVGLLQAIFSEKSRYSTHEVQNVENMMVDIATPFEVGNSRVFPMDFLDKIATVGGTDEYVRAVQKVANLHEKQRIEQLAAIAETF